MRINARSYIFFFVFFFLIIPLAKTNTAESVFFDNYDEDQGLIHNYVLSIFQDSRGIVWVGTYGGVQTFNGYNFNHFNVSGKKSNILTNQVVNVIYEDNQKHLWFGTENGLNQYNLNSGTITQYFSKINNKKSISHNNIRTIYQDKKGIFWIGTYGGGLNRYDNKTNTFTHYRSKTGDMTCLQSDLINTFFVDKYGLFWIGTENGGVSVFDKDKNKMVLNFQAGPGRLTTATANTIFQDTYDNIWIGTWNGGLNKYNPRTGKFTYSTFNSNQHTVISRNNIRCILQTEKNFLWIATFGEGLFKFDIKTEQYTKININSTKEGNSSQDLIWTLYRDIENNLWMGTFGKGLFKVNILKSTFPHTALQSEGDVKLSISSIIEDHHQNLWIGTLNRGIYIYNRKQHTYFKFSNPAINHENISKIYMDSKDRIWIGADAALYVIYPDRKRIRHFTYNPLKTSGISESSINSILEDKNGNIWIGFWGTGINVLNKAELNKQKDDDVVFTKYITQPNDTSSLLHDRIWNLFEDAKGTVWIGTSGELTYYTNEDKTFRTIPINVVSSFFEDNSGYLWVGSIGNGLFKLDKNKQILKKYGNEEGLACMDILSILTDKKGRLWLGTSNGLSVLDPQSENIFNFDKNYGLQRFSITHNACTVLKSGEMILGGINGFNLFVPENINQDLIKSLITITDIKLNNKSIVYENVMDSSATIFSSIANLDTLLLDFKNKVLTIDFAAVNYAAPSSITYAYKLEGFDEDWVITPSNNRSVTYTNLSVGEYVFHIKMSYSQGKWIENSRKLRIIIKPPIWKRNWFKLTILLSLFTLGWWIFNIKLGRTKLVKLMNQKQNLAEKLSKEYALIQLKNDQLTETMNLQNKHIASIGLQQDAYGKSSDFTNNINILFDDFPKRFIDSHPKLTSTDLRICSFIRMNKSNKEIAKHLSITIGSLETSRHRIRKKLSLPTETNLNDYILRF